MAAHEKDSKAWLGPGGTVATNVDRQLLVVGTALTSGQLELFGIYIPGGTVVASIGFWSSAAATSPTNQIFGIYDIALARQCFTTNDTTTAWNGNTLKSLALSGGSWTCPASEMYYAAVMVTASGPPTLYGYTLVNTALSTTQTPRLCGLTPDMGLTTTIPATAGAVGTSSAFRGAWLF